MEVQAHGTTYAVEFIEAHLTTTTTRVFAAYIENGLWPIGALTVDERQGTVELVYVEGEFRRQGIATALLERAREVTGLALDRDTGERSPAGRAWATAMGLTGGHRRKLAQREADAMGARLMLGLWGMGAAVKR